MQYDESIINKTNTFRALLQTRRIIIILFRSNHHRIFHFFFFFVIEKTLGGFEISCSFVILSGDLFVPFPVSSFPRFIRRVPAYIVVLHLNRKTLPLAATRERSRQTESK